MESLHNSNQAETAESGPLSPLASYRDAQVWKDIEAETGFASYEDYLEYYKEVQPGFREKLRIMRDNEKRREEFPTDEQSWTVVYDLSMEERYPPQPTLRCYCESGTELIHTLRKPPHGVCVQLVLWFRTDSPLNQEMIDTLGLGLRLDLDDFDYREPWSPPPRKLGPHIRSIFGEQTVATISQGFMRDVANEVPVVLVATAFEGRFINMLRLGFITDYCETPPFCKSPRVILPLENRGGSFIRAKGRDYARAVQNFISQGRDVQSTKLSLLLASISPLLYAEICRITRRINGVQEMYTAFMFEVSNEGIRPRVSQEALDRHRLELRRITEVAEDVLGQFSRYLGSESHSDASNHPSYIRIVAELRSVIADARRLDAEVRDFKQIEVGDLVLEESRKSIELSNTQIREAKSGKFPNDMCVDYANVF